MFNALDMLFVQSIGFVAFGFGIGAFLQKNDKKLKLMLAAQCFFLCIHFYLLGAQGGAAMTGIGMIRNLMAASNRNLKPLAWVFIGIYTLAGVIRYEEWVDGLPVIASVVATYGIFHVRGISLRRCLFFGTSMWFIHNILVGSIGPTLMEMFMLCANIKTMYHLHKEKTAQAGMTKKETSA